MENTARLFNCARCYCQVIICNDCDRGHIYCNKKCSQLSRSESLRMAGQRYQNSRQGKFKHAARQKRYRDRRKNVTHHTSTHLPSGDLLLIEPNEEAKNVMPRSTGASSCDFCGDDCFKFLRVGFLNREPRNQMDTLSILPLGP